MAKKYKLTQDGPEVQALLNKIDELKANIAPVSGETPTALESLSLEGVLYSVLTKAVNDLLNYYTKDDTYTKDEVATALANALAGLHDVKYTAQSLTDSQKAQARTNIGAGTYSKPSSGIPSSDMADGVIPDISGKADKEGEFPDMLVGTAESLLGTGSQVSDFVFSPMPGADGIAKLNAARGKSLVWNQKVSPFNLSERTRYGATFSVNAGVFEIVATEGTTQETLNANLLNENSLGFRQQAGHKYYSPNTLPNGVYFTQNVYGTGYTPCSGLIMDGRDSSSTYNQWSLKAYVGTIIPQKVYCPIIVFDLTLMFGAGNEPSSVAEFEKMFPLSYYDYDQGRIISNKTESVKVTGFNQWDKRQIQNGYISDADGGVKTNLPGRNTGYIEILPNTTYFIKSDAPNGRWGAWYDANKNYISGVTGIGDGKVSPSNARFLRFTIDYNGNSGNPDTFCINISDPARNGQYVPYKTNTIQLNLPTLTGKLNGEGESVVVFPDGLKSAGSVYDEIVGNKAIKRVGVVDMGSLSWNVGNAAGGFYASTGNIGRKSSSNNLLVRKYATISSTNTFTDKSICQRPGSGNENWINAFDSAYANNTGSQFKAAMSGVLLYYELATPEEYILDEPLPGTFRGYKGGTIKQLPENTSVPVTAPMVMEATYPVEAKLEPEIFWATYGVTTVAEIEAALNAGKIVAMLYSNKVYFVTANNDPNYLVFTSPSDDTIFNIRVNRSDSSYGNPFNFTYERAARKKSTISGNESSDAYYPTTKAVADAIEAGKQIFWAEYGVNTLSEITTAYNSGKAVLCLRQGALYVISKLETTYCYFTCVNRTASQFLLLNGQTSWSAGTVSLQSTGNLSQSVPTDLESTTKYPSVKAVADAISNLAQSLTASSKKIWAGTAAEYALLTPSDDTIYFIKP